jgi:hypothetical protein
MGGGKIVANVNPESFHGGVADLVEMPADANARLISAAPDLLDALEKMLDLYTAFDGPIGPTVIMARAAIEKAKPVTHNA